MDTKAVNTGVDSEEHLEADNRKLNELSGQVGLLLDNISQIVLGKRDVARECLIALLAGEHVLLEDVPGVGKTLMGKAIARSIDGSFRRIQFTPDLLPSDIVGSNIFNSNTNEFEFNAGPVFSNFVLADEINRAPPRTQSALLEAMSDNQVSVDGVTRELPEPFMVIATQNPFEFEGTYLLPESQMDRFLFRISMGYPDRDFEQQILDSHRPGNPLDEMQSVCQTNQIIAIQEAVRNVTIENSISSYMMDIVQATRSSTELSLGASTRGALLWYRAVQACAFIAGRAYAIPDDAKELAVKVLAHRVKPAGAMGLINRNEIESIIREIIRAIVVPE